MRLIRIAFNALTSQFKKFETDIKVEKTPDKRSLSGLESKINEEIKPWGAVFNLEVSGPDVGDIVKGFIRYRITDSELNEPMDASSFGHGFQRHLIFALLRISATYTIPKAEPKKKENSKRSSPP